MKKMASQGLRMKKWPGDCHDVDVRMLIPWLKMDRRMDTQSSRNGEWKFGRKGLYIVVGPTLSLLWMGVVVAVFDELV